jgi:UDP-N-acetylglucosamine diphosphorylase / glucose-1-phosphate thymidylyltransferase / UDP-N-acetylgalactosamine diphosphorylase / glucosamine-1-phosphate N-acetyltransferase / galactosamine-1-phosphate N-acetyltransferase
MITDHFLQNHYLPLTADNSKLPWEIIAILDTLIRSHLSSPGSGFRIVNDIAIHESAIVEQNVVIKAPAFIGRNCFVGAHAYLRNGVFLDENVKIGPGCEIKSSCIFENSAISHFNFIGDSLIGRNVNFEAGAVVANHFNEKTEKRIYVSFMGRLIDTGTVKFGALVGDNSRIGANAVLSPGTMLEMNSIVGRLELIEQVK